MELRGRFKIVIDHGHVAEEDEKLERDLKIAQQGGYEGPEKAGG